jgi:hypothetical protein
MMVRRKQVPIWNAGDIGAEPSQLDMTNAHTEIVGLSVPTRKTECEFISADTPAEAAVDLAQKLNKLV